MADDFSITRVPESARLPMWEIMLIRTGGLIALSQFMLGAALGYGLTFWQAFWATMLGSVLLELVSLFLGLAGVREGLSTSLLARWTGFGKYGSGAIGIVIAIGLVGWFGIQNSVFAKGVDGALGGVLGFPLAAIITGLGVTLIVIFGLKWLSWTAKIAVPGFLAVISYGVYVVLQDHSLGELIASPPPGPVLSFGMATTMVAGGFMMGAIITPDLSRYCRSGKDVFWMTMSTVIFGELGVNLIAVLMAHAIKSADVVTIILQTAGWFGAAVVIFSTIKINDINLYSASLGITGVIDSVLGKKVNRGLITLIIGAIGTVLSVVGILDQFVGFLMFLGVLIPPIGGIMIVDYFILKRSRGILDESRKQSKLPEHSEKFNPITLISWAIGFFVGYLIEAGIPSVNSLLVSGIVYYIGMKMLSSIRKRKTGQEINV